MRVAFAREIAGITMPVVTYTAGIVFNFLQSHSLAVNLKTVSHNWLF